MVTRVRVILLLLVAGPLVHAQDALTYDDLVKRLSPKLAGLKSWSADMNMTIRMMGQIMTATGTTATQGGLTMAEMTMTMMGVPMQLKSVLGEDGIQWNDTTMGEERRVYKTDLEQMSQLFAADGRTYERPEGGFMEDPSKMLAQYGEIFDMSVSGKDEIDGVPVHRVEGKLKSPDQQSVGSAGSVLADTSAAMTAMGMSIEPLRLAVGADDGFVRLMTLGDDNGTPWVSMGFGNVKTNVELDASLFQYSPPPDVLIMDMAEIARGQIGGPIAPEESGPKFEIGQEAPDFEGVNLAGETVKLSGFRGKIVLVDFWATWCGPCVQELPNVIAAYEKHHGKGFEIVGVSLDDDQAKLTEFLKKQPKMSWVQLFDGKGWESGIGTQYGVDSIPFTLLLDREGKIVGMDLRGDALHSAIAELLD